MYVLYSMHGMIIAIIELICILPSPIPAHVVVVLIVGVVLLETTLLHNWTHCLRDIYSAGIPRYPMLCSPLWLISTTTFISDYLSVHEEVLVAFLPGHQDVLVAFVLNVEFPCKPLCVSASVLRTTEVIVVVFLPIHEALLVVHEHEEVFVEFPCSPLCVPASVRRNSLRCYKTLQIGNHYISSNRFAEKTVDIRNTYPFSPYHPLPVFSLPYSYRTNLFLVISN